MECKEIVLEKRKCVIHYVKNNEDLKAQIDDIGEILKVFYFPNEGERLSEQDLFSILNDKTPKVFFTSPELIGSDIYTEMDLVINYSSSSHYHYYVDDHVGLSFSLKQ